jgi:signal transduction histidine kinase
MTSDRWRHDLKNELGIIRGFAELVLQDLPPDDGRRADVEEIQAAARRATELLDEMGLSPAEDA